MPLILNIETSCSVCSVVLSNNDLIIDKKQTEIKNSHSAKLTIYIEEIFKYSELQISDLDAVSVSKGPGSYTGLRIGVSTAKGIAYGAGIPLISVNTLQSMTSGIIDNIDKYLLENKDNIIFCPMIDARRMEVYSAFFNLNNKQIVETSADIIENNSYIDLLDKNKIIFFGDGASKCKNTITHENAVFIDNIFPLAENMIKLSEKAYENKNFEDVAYFEPFYLKDFLATKPKKNIFT